MRFRLRQVFENYSFTLVCKKNAIDCHLTTYTVRANKI